MFQPNFFILQCTTLTVDQIYASAVALSTTVSPEEENEGRLYPELERIREVSVIVARQVIREAQSQGLDREPSLRGLTDAKLDTWIREKMYDPTKENGLNEESLKTQVRGEPVKSLL